VENKRGRTPLDFAEHLANKNPESLANENPEHLTNENPKALAEKSPEESEQQEIVDFLRDWNSEQHEVDDATIVNAAKKIWGLSGGTKVKAGKAVIEAFKGAAKQAPVAAAGGAALGACEGAAKCTWKNIRDGAIEGAIGGAIAGGIVGATVGGLTGAVDGALHISEKVVEGLALGAAAYVNGCRVASKSDSQQSSTKKPAVKKEEPRVIEKNYWVPPKKEDSSASEKSSGTSKEEDPEMEYYCGHCNARFWRRRSNEIRCGSERKNTCQRCGRLGARASFLSSFGGHSFGGHSFGGHSFADARCGLSEKEDPEMEYYCEHCNAKFWRRRSNEIRCGSEHKNTCQRCGRLGART
jgi:hypothetical protein